MRVGFTTLVAGALLLGGGAAPAVAQAEQTFTLTIKDHKFEPSTLEVPANAKFKLVIKNLDDSAEEFEMTSPKREKVVKGGQEGTVTLGPFKPGTYEFFGDYHPQTAKGRIVAK
jgi:plastocyanin